MPRSVLSPATNSTYYSTFELPAVAVPTDSSLENNQPGPRLLLSTWSSGTRDRVTNRLSLPELVKPFDRRANFSALYPFNIPSIPPLPYLRDRLSSTGPRSYPLTTKLGSGTRAENYSWKREKPARDVDAIPRVIDGYIRSSDRSGPNVWSWRVH